MGKTEEIMEILQRPFPAGDIEWRIAQCGMKRSGQEPWAKVLAYITARAVHERLDEAFGLFGWRNEFREFIIPGGEAGIICRISFRDPDTSEWCWKENGAPQTGYEPFKGGLSDSEKRTFAELGGGRYLYKLTANWAIIALEKSDATPYFQAEKKEGKGKDHCAFWWGPPKLPAFALPEGEKSPGGGQRKVIEEEPTERQLVPPRSSPSGNVRTGPTEEPLRDTREQERSDDEESPFGDEVYKGYPNLEFPPPGTKGINALRACAGHAQLLEWSEQQFVGWCKGIVKGKELKNINAAQAVLLLQKIKKIHKPEGVESDDAQPSQPSAEPLLKE